MEVHPVNRIVVIIASYNRKQKTCAAIGRLLEQEGVGTSFSVDIVLVDDNSTDGTRDEVQRRWPHVRVVRGTGGLFWNGAMRLGISIARKLDPDFLLWLNDDVELQTDALSRTLRCYRAEASTARGGLIVVGACRDRVTGESTYGGVKSVGKLNPLKFDLLAIRDAAQPCDTMNGNFVLVPMQVFERVGGLDAAFSHGIADFEFGLRAVQRGATLLVAPDAVGFCSRNSLEGTWQDSRAPMRKRVRHLFSKKGMPPTEIWTLFRRHGGSLWLINYLRTYLRVAVRLPFDAIMRRKNP